MERYNKPSVESKECYAETVVVQPKKMQVVLDKHASELESNTSTSESDNL